jgi:2-dehydropantoate 2-reductase
VPVNAGRFQVAIVGAGGVGGLLGGLLIREGVDVRFVVTDATASVLKSEGVRIRSERFGNFTVPAQADTALASPVDICVVAVKAMHLEAATDRVPARVLADGIVIPFLNGVEHVDTLRRLYGTAVVAGTVRVASARTAGGVIEHSSPFLRVEIALTGERDVPSRQTILTYVELLTTAGVDVDIREDELSMLWGKLMFLCPLALLTTRYGITAGDVRTGHRGELVAVINEVADVAGALGASLSAEEALAFFDSVPPGMRSSMQHDAATGSPIELDAIGGSVLRAGERSGIPTPGIGKLVADLGGIASP